MGSPYLQAVAEQPLPDDPRDGMADGLKRQRAFLSEAARLRETIQTTRHLLSAIDEELARFNSAW